MGFYIIISEKVKMPKNVAWNLLGIERRFLQQPEQRRTVASWLRKGGSKKLQSSARH